MKTIQITIAGTGRKKVHDGLGGKHLDGAVVSLPDEVADGIVASGAAKFLDGSSAIAARAEDAEARERRRVENAKRGADARMAIWDSLPAEVRARANEEGDGVIEAYLAGRPTMSLDDYNAAPGEPFIDARPEPEVQLPPRRRRGRPPKNRPAIEGNDA